MSSRICVPLVYVAFALLPSLACSDHVPSVTSRDPLADLPTWTVERLLEIGSEVDMRYALTPIGGFAISPAGHLYVSQPQDRHIRVFDMDGTFVRAIGRRGEGPGEFLRLGEIGFAGDTLWAADARAGAFLHFLSPEGQPYRMRRLPAPARPHVGSGRYYPLRDGGVLMQTASAGELMRREHEQPWLRWSADDSLVAVLPGYLSPAITVIDHHLSIAGRTVSSPIAILPPLSARSWLDLAPDVSSIVRADYDDSNAGSEVTLRLVRYSPFGDTTARNAFSVPRQAVPAHVADSILEAEVTRVAREIGGQERARRALAGVFHIPEWYPPVRMIFVDSDTRTWIAVQDSSDSRWLLLDSDLAPQAWIDLRDRTRLAAAQGDDIWTIELDDLDVPRIVRYILRRAV